ncbi:TRAP transporter small permease subunit [Marinobacter changyiensis]|uniref:TRAP transporter small permease subunit n=1 Tax=Marinobacter changyiensis TaxID=2604091 RepID=UPI0012647117|nr:TRAP transporter small permease subunit [Marinobacter changyiensis]
MNSNAGRLSHSLPPWRTGLARILATIAIPLIAIGNWLGRVSSWLVLAIMFVVLTTVLMNALGWNELLHWENKVLLLGNALTINSVTEMQWHLFGLLTLIGGSYALHSDTHVRVDMVHHHLSPIGKHWVDIIGHLVFLIPFCVLVAWLSKHFVSMAYVSGEQSNYGGLTDRYLIKGALPAGLVLLALSALGQVFDRLAKILDPRREAKEPHYAG